MCPTCARSVRDVRDAASRVHLLPTTEISQDYNVPPPVSHLLTQMIATTPSERPTAAKARTILSSIISELSLGELKAAAWED